MKNEAVTQTIEDSAWVSVDLPLPPGELYTFMQKIERLYRLNPFLEIKSWEEEKPGSIYSGKKIRLDSINEMNGLQQKLLLEVIDVQPDVSFSLNYDNGLKQSSIFTVHGLTPYSSQLIVKECYPSEISAAERESRLNEVDRSLVPWGEAIHNYFVRRRRWGWLPFFNSLQDSFWLGMTPRHRRIARLLILTTALEFVVFLFVFIIYWLELGRG